MSAPIRLRLSQAAGFDLQALSRAINGLRAVKVDRTTKWGNLWIVGPRTCGCRSVGECTHDSFRCDNAADAVEAYRDWATHWRQKPDGSGLYNALKELNGKNLACWCALDQPCHANVLLEIANR